MNELSHDKLSRRVLVGEPVLRPDQRLVSVYKTEGGIEVGVGSICSGYSDAEVELLGDGEWREGFMRVVQAHYTGDAGLIGLRPLNEEIERRETGIL